MCLPNFSRPYLSTLLHCPYTVIFSVLYIVLHLNWWNTILSSIFWCSLYSWTFSFLYQWLLPRFPMLQHRNSHPFLFCVLIPHVRHHCGRTLHPCHWFSRQGCFLVTYLLILHWVPSPHSVLCSLLTALLFFLHKVSSAARVKGFHIFCIKSGSLRRRGCHFLPCPEGWKKSVPSLDIECLFPFAPDCS